MARSQDRRPGYSRRAQYGIFTGYVVAILGVVAGVAVLLIGLGLGHNGLTLILEPEDLELTVTQQWIGFVATLGTMIIANVWFKQRLVAVGTAKLSALVPPNVALVTT